MLDNHAVFGTITKLNDRSPPPVVMGNQVAAQLRMQEMNPDTFLTSPSNSATSYKKDAEQFSGERSMAEPEKRVTDDRLTHEKSPDCMLQVDRPSGEKNRSRGEDTESRKRKCYTIYAEDNQLPDSTCSDRSLNSKQARDREEIEKQVEGIEGTIVKHIQSHKDSASSFSIKITVEQIDGQRSSDAVNVDDKSSNKVPMISYTTSIENSTHDLNSHRTTPEDIPEKQPEKISHIETTDDLIHYIAAREFSKDKMTSFNVTHSRVIDKIVHRVNNEMVERHKISRPGLERGTSSSDSPPTDVASTPSCPSRQVLERTIEERSVAVEKRSEHCTDPFPHIFATPLSTSQSRQRAHKRVSTLSSYEEHSEQNSSSNPDPTQLRLGEDPFSPPQPKVRRTDLGSEEAANFSSQKQHTPITDARDTLPVIASVYSESPDWNNKQTPSAETKKSDSKKSPSGRHYEPLDLSMSKASTPKRPQWADAVPVPRAPLTRSYPKESESRTDFNNLQLPYMSPPQFSAFPNPLTGPTPIRPAYTVNNRFNPTIHHYPESRKMPGRWEFNPVDDPPCPVYHHVQKVGTTFRLPYPTYFSKPFVDNSMKPPGWNYRPPF